MASEAIIPSANLLKSAVPFLLLMAFLQQWRKIKESDKQMTLSAFEFIRRFMLHLLPSHFVRVRYYGFLARGFKAKALLVLRRELKALPIAKPALNPHSIICSCCTTGILIKIAEIPRTRPCFKATSPPFLRSRNTSIL